MHIRAPKTGFATLKVSPNARVAAGTLLYEFDPAEDQLELLKVETALALLQVHYDRAVKFAAGGGEASNLAAKRKARFESAHQAFFVLREARAREYALGTALKEPFEHASTLLLLAKQHLAEAVFANQNLLDTAKESVEVLRSQLEYNQLLLAKTRLDIKRLRVLAPVNGTIKLALGRSGWVAQGSILATMGG